MITHAYGVTSMTSLQKVAGLPLYFLALSLWSSKTTAEINVIKKNTFSHPLLAPLSLKIVICWG